MTIEISPPASKAPKAASSAGAHGAKAAAKSPGDAATDAGASGFMAILGSLGDAVQQDPAPVADPSETVAVDPSQTAAPFDASTLLQQNPQIAAAQAATLAAQAAQAAQSPASGATAGTAKDASSVIGNLLSQDGKNTPLLPDTQSPRGESDQQSATQPALAAQDRSRPSLVGMAAAMTQPAEEKAGVSESATQGLQRTGTHAKWGKDSTLAASDSSSANGSNISNGLSGTEKPDLKDAKLLAALEQVKSASAVRAPEPALVPLLAKGEKPMNERASFSEKNTEPTYTGTTLGVSGPEFSATVDPSATVPPEMQVAEQVTYWVSQNVQNAEMKLDGLGQSPVEVSISVQGNEAQISFRSDEAQTRGVLEGAGSHLKDMLQREGMVLTGVSVGTSGGGDGSGAGNDRRGRPPVRQALIAPLETAKAPLTRRAGSGAGRSVDLFV